MNPKRPRRLTVGDTAPTFSTRDIYGRKIDSKKIEGYTLLVFLRYAGCPLCNMAIYRLSREHNLLKKNGCQVVAFVQSTEENIKKNIIARQSTNPPFPIIADQERDFYKLFGVTPSILKATSHAIVHASSWMDAAFKKGFRQSNIDGNWFMVPAFFLIDKRGTILGVDYNSSFYDDKTFTTIYELLTFGVAET